MGLGLKRFLFFCLFYWYDLAAILNVFEHLEKRYINLMYYEAKVTQKPPMLKWVFGPTLNIFPRGNWLNSFHKFSVFTSNNNKKT